MSVPSIALCLRFLRNGALGMGALLGFSLGLLVLVYGALSYVGLPTFDNENGQHLQFSFFFVAWLFCAAVIFQGNQSLKPYYALPVTTSTIVGSQMLTGCVVGGAGYLLLAVTLNVTYGAGWATFGAALFIAANAAWAQAIGWSFRGSPGLMAMSGAVAFILAAGWTVVRSHAHMAGELLPGGAWGNVNLFEFLCLLGLIGVAYLCAVCGVSLDRRGEAPTLEAVARWVSRQGEKVIRLVGALEDLTPQHLPRHALLRFDLRNRYPFLAAMILLPISVAVIWNLAPWVSVKDTVGLSRGLTTVGVLLAGCLGLLVPQYRADMRLGDFRAALPVGDRELACSLLKLAGGAALVAWIAWISGMAVIGLRLVWLGQGEPLLRAIGQPLTTVAAHLGICLGLSWATAGIGVALGLLRKEYVMGLFFTGLTFLFASIGVGWVLTEPWLSRFQYGCLFTVLVAVTGITVGAFFWGAWKKLITHATIGWCLVATITIMVAAVTTGWIPEAHKSDPLLQGLSILTLSVLPVAPFATAPLAVWFNRHR